MLTQSDGPYTHATLIQALAAAERDVGEFFGSLSADEFVLRSASAWTPAEHLEHLNAAVSAVARGLAIPAWLLRIRFGRPRAPSRTYEQLRTDYQTRLEQGAGASGRFLPGRESLTDDGSMVRRTRLLSRWYHVNNRLRSALKGRTEEDLDRIQLPHPILGRITVREMVFFTIYHNHHHIAATRRRLPRFSPAAAPPDGPTRGPKAND